jgi:hypothetical protein
MKVMVGKTMELVGMVIVLVGFLYGIQFSLIKFELGALGIGASVFYAGWLLEKKG